MTPPNSAGTGNHPQRLGVRAVEGETQAADLIAELVAVLRRAVAPAVLTAHCDGSISRIPPAAAASPEFRDDARVAVFAVGDHLARQPARRRRPRSYRVEFSAAPATGTLRCEIQSFGTRPESCEYLAEVLRCAHAELMDTAPGRSLRFALYPQVHDLR